MLPLTCQTPPCTNCMHGGHTCLGWIQKLMPTSQLTTACQHHRKIHQSKIKLTKLARVHCHFGSPTTKLGGCTWCAQAAPRVGNKVLDAVFHLSINDLKGCAIKGGVVKIAGLSFATKHGDSTFPGTAVWFVGNRGLACRVHRGCHAAPKMCRVCSGCTGGVQQACRGCTARCASLGHAGAHKQTRHPPPC